MTLLSQGCSADKKWFVQPSLSVKPGEVSETTEVIDVSQITIAEIGQCILYMETAAVLELRKVLDSSNPVHQAILKAAGLMPVGSLVPGASSNPSASIHSKLGIKRKLPFDNIISQTHVDLSGMTPRTYMSTSRLEYIDLTQS